MQTAEEINENRLRNEIVYFLQNTNNVDMQKLNGLFYAADKMCIEETAFNISDSEYLAMERGPLLGCILGAFHVIVDIADENNGYFILKNDIVFDKSHFTDAEISVLKAIAAVYKDVSATAMKQQFCSEGEPWQIYLAEGGQFIGRIPLEKLVERHLPAKEREEREALRREAEETQRLYQSLENEPLKLHFNIG